MGDKFPGEPAVVGVSRGVERLGVPDDVASMVTFLLRDAASCISRPVFVVDGGLLTPGAV